MRTIVPSRFRGSDAPESGVRPGAIPTKPPACRPPMPHRDMARVLPSKFDPGLGLHAAPERMFHQSHLSHQVGYLDECIGCVPASHDHMGHGGLGLESCNDFVERQIVVRSEEHTSELQSLMRISYAVFCLKKKKITKIT